MIGIQITNDGIYTSDGAVRNTPPYIDWLLDYHRGEPKIMYDMAGSVASLLRLIGAAKEDGAQLQASKKLQLDAYRLTYFPDTFFGIDKGEHGGHAYANFINMGTYQEPRYTGVEGPDDNLRKAAEAKAVGDQIVAVYKDLGLDTNNIASPISAFLKKYKINIFPAANIQGELDIVLYLARDSIKGNWLEAFERGYFDHAYDYDINGAYASELIKLLDLWKGYWVDQKNPPDEAVYGFANGMLTTSREFHPFIYNDKTNRNISVSLTPTGSRPDKLPLEKIRLLKQYDMGKWVPHRGVWWIPQGRRNEIFKGPVTYLWNKRNQTEGIQREVIKRTLTGLWGKTFESHINSEGREKLGDYYQPVYASVVENAIQCRVVKACLDNNVTPLHVAVDGVITDRKLKLDEGPNLGQWRLSHEGRCIIASAGTVGFEGKAGVEEFSLTFDWLNNAIKKSPRKTQYTMTKYTPVTLSRALSLGWDQIGVVGQVQRVVYIKDDPKRMWIAEPKNGGDLLKNTYKSSPWDCSVLGIGG